MGVIIYTCLPHKTCELEEKKHALLCGKSPGPSTLLSDRSSLNVPYMNKGMKKQLAKIYLFLVLM